MKISITTRNLILVSTLVCAVWAMSSLISCGGDSPTGGGGTQEFASGNLGVGQSFTHVFDSVQTIPYYCRYHRLTGMTGVITVNAGGTPSTITFSITSSVLPSPTIDVGDTITWTNNHSTPIATIHTVESVN